jgi:protein-S-isoprenylcysteine O-methyltransferase Ste14/predicted nicotinamide N-methyase
MPTVALAGFALFFLLAFGLRTASHVRRTGTTGFVALRAAGVTERTGGALFAAALLAAMSAPTLALLGVVRSASMLDVPVVHAAGLVLFAGGLAGTLAAQYGMGNSWRIGVDASERTALVTGGIFSRIRNPIFTSMTVALVGLALLTPSWVAALAIGLMLVALEVHVRLVEEPYLLRTHGAAYAEYGARTGRFVPGIGRLAARPVVDFVPALGLPALTPLYDFFAWLAGDRIIKRHLVATAGVAAGHDVLDLGCGTGTLAILTAERVPGARVVGLDVDPAILARARRKVARAGTRVMLAEGSATAPPFLPASFDRVLTTLVLHHLTTPQKRDALRAVRTLLRPGGELHVADFGRPHNRLMRAVAAIVHHVDGDAAVSGNLRGEVPTLMREAGLVDVDETEHWMTPFGTLTFVRGACPRA